MGRVLYIVARQRPLLCGYLMTTVGARSSDGHVVEIQLDERRGERRQASEARDPDRRTGERRLRPSLDDDLRSRGYATVVQADTGPSRTGRPTPEPAMAWRRRSTRRERATRAGRRSLRQWGLVVVGLLAVVGVSIALVRSIHRTAPPPRAPELAAPLEEARPPSPSSKATPAVSAPPALRPSRPGPVRVVTTRASGVVLFVNPKGRALVLEDKGAEAGRLRVELAPDARVVLSERNDQPENLDHPFKDTVIGLSEVRTGDFVVVEMRGPEGKELARSVKVTFRRK